VARDTKIEVIECQFPLCISLLCGSMVPLTRGIHSLTTEEVHIQRSHFGLILREGFSQSAMISASALKRGRHLPENMLKFNVPGGECLSLGHLLRT
jgi:hypothetical protein